MRPAFRFTRLLRRSIWLASLVLLAGCSSLQPQSDRPAVRSHPPADSALWRAVDTVRAGDWQVPLNTGRNALDWRLRAIDSAVDSIALQTFLWEMDSVGTLILDHLVSAADRGVSVRLLVDDSLLTGADELVMAIAMHPNIQYRIYNPFKRRAGGAFTRTLLNATEFHRLDHRMHNKAMIVDNRVAIVGGRNLADEYFGSHTETNFRDMEVLVGGPVVAAISRQFDDYWNDRWAFDIHELSHVRAATAELDRIRHTPAVASAHVEDTRDANVDAWVRLASDAFSGSVQLFADRPPENRPDDPADAPVEVANELFELFESARHDITIASAYLIPTPYLEGAIDRAVKRGVTVRILTNSIRSNNHLAAHSAYRNHVRTLMVNGAELHEVRVDAVDRHRYMLAPVDAKLLSLHAKLLLIDDDRVFVGSANLDPRSLRINTEMGLLISSRALNATLRNFLEPDFSQENAWHLQFDDRGQVVWVNDREVRTTQPAAGILQHIEDWFFAHLPIEGEM